MSSPIANNLNLEYRDSLDFIGKFHDFPNVSARLGKNTN